MDVQQLRVLVAIIEEGSFTAAARRLYLTQSGVSRALSSLEAEIGMAVLERSRSGVRATQLGERVLGHARAAISSIDAVRQEAAAFAGLEAGSVKIGAFPSICARLLPSTIAAFEARYPGISVELWEGSGVEVLQWVENSGIDVGFVGLPLQDSEAKRLDTLPVICDRMVVVVQRDHPLAETPHAGELHRLAEEPFILPRGHHERTIAQILRNAGIRPRIKFKVRDANSILALVGHGLGWSVVNEMSIPSTATEIYATPILPATEHEIGTAIRSSGPTPPAVHAFVEFVKHSGTGQYR